MFMIHLDVCWERKGQATAFTERNVREKKVACFGIQVRPTIHKAMEIHRINYFRKSVPQREPSNSVRQGIQQKYNLETWTKEGRACGQTSPAAFEWLTQMF